jgi:hypothetical protein
MHKNFYPKKIEWAVIANPFLAEKQVPEMVLKDRNQHGKDRCKT